MIKQVVNTMQTLKEDKGIAYTNQCNELDLPYSTVGRWRSRKQAGRELYQAPGPKPVEPLDMDALTEQIGQLKHCAKRTHGTGALFVQVEQQISRRDFQACVREVRAEANRQRRQEMECINWLAPGLVWAMDDTEMKNPYLTCDVQFHSVRDLASRNTFDPLVGKTLAKGKNVAENLRRLFTRYGAPLFMKRDGGSNLNDRHVANVLKEYFVIPVNSPPGYPQYNGAIEKGQDEIKKTVEEKEYASMQELVLASRLCACLQNQKPRRCLKGYMPCTVFEKRREIMSVFTKRKRREVYDQLLAITTNLALAAEGKWNVDTLWRLAVKMWLLDHECITITGKVKCYPFLTRNIAQN